MAGPVGAAAELDADDDPAAELEPAAEELPADEPAAELAADELPADELGAAAELAADEAADVLDAEDDDEELSVLPAPQAASATVRVTAPAAAMNRRDVVLRMEPLSAGSKADWERKLGGEVLGARRKEPT